MNKITFIGNLLENQEFLIQLGDRFKFAGGVKPGFSGAYFEIADKKYVYIAHAVSLPLDKVNDDKGIIDVFEGLLMMSGTIAGTGISYDRGDYVALRTVECKPNNGRLEFFIRAVQV